MQFVEEESEYWEGLASALAVGWLDFVVSFLRLHGSYRHDQIDNRQTENGLVEAVAVLVSNMPRLRPSLPAGALGVAFSFKPEFAREWERWRMQLAKLDRSSFWSECHHKATLHGLKKLLEILQGKNEVLVSTTSHWMELFVAHCLHVRPFSTASDGLTSLARSCIELNMSSRVDELQELILAIIAEDTEVVIAECAQLFDPWMMVHIMELLTAKSTYAESLLRKENDVPGGISLEELHRVFYAQALASHPLTWQLATVYLAVCLRQGLGMLETLLLKQPVSGDNRLALKTLELCRLYDLQSVRTAICKKIGIYNWKHGRKGAGIVWLQRAQDNRLLSSLTDQLLASVFASSTVEKNESFEQVQGLVGLLGSEFRATGRLAFLHGYRNFKTALRSVQELRAKDTEEQKLRVAGRLAVDSLMEVELLEWPEQVLLSTAETNSLLNCMQELKLAKICGDLENLDLSGPSVDRVRLAMATNLGRSFLQV